MLNTLLKCPNKFVSSAFLKNFLNKDNNIKTYGLRSGHIETDLHTAGLNITMVCNRYHVWEFWKCFIEVPERLLNTIEYYHREMKTGDLSYFKDNWYKMFEDPIERAAMFYLFNRYSISGATNCFEISKHNFSKFNIASFEKAIPFAKSLKVKFTANEDFVDSFKNIKDDATVLVPIGKLKLDQVLKKETRSIDTANYDLHSLKEYISLSERKTLLIFKYNKQIDLFFDNKIYINNYGIVTEDPNLAEDLIVTNINYG